MSEYDDDEDEDLTPWEVQQRDKEVFRCPYSLLRIGPFTGVYLTLIIMTGVFLGVWLVNKLESLVGP